MEKLHLIISDQSIDDVDLQESAEDEDEDDQPPEETRYELVKGISVRTTYLIDLLPTLAQVSRYYLKGDETEKDTQPVDFSVSGPAQFYVSRVVDKYPTADIRLVQRLGEANWQRHLRIRQQMEKGSRTDMHVAQYHVTAQSVFKSTSLFHDSGLGPSILAQSSYAPSQASHTSFMSSLASSSKHNLHVPHTPVEVGLGKPFDCEICGHLLSRIKSRIDWKYVLKHLDMDYLLTLVGFMCLAIFNPTSARGLNVKTNFRRFLLEDSGRTMNLANIESLESGNVTNALPHFLALTNGDLTFRVIALANYLPSILQMRWLQPNFEGQFL